MNKRIHGTSPVERSTSCKPSSLERLRSDPEFPGAMELKVSGDTGFVIEELSRQHAVDEQRELARSGGDGFGFSDAGLAGGGKRPRVRLKFYPRSSRSGAGWPRPVGRRRSPGAEPASSGDFVVGGERGPGGEVVFAGQRLMSVPISAMICSAFAVGRTICLAHFRPRR